GINVFAFDGQSATLIDAIDAEGVDVRVDRVHEFRGVLAVVARNRDLGTQLRAVREAPGAGTRAALAIHRSPLQRQLGGQLGDARLVDFGLDRLLHREIDDRAVDHIRLIQELTGLADVHAADETRTEFGPRRLHGQDRDVAVDQRPARNVPPVVVVV